MAGVTLAISGSAPKECLLFVYGKYRVGQLYTISKHSHQESDKGEGVEVVKNEPHEDPVHGRGQFTEKRVHLSSKLPSWARAVTPRIFYITEKAWNYYPYTITAWFVNLAGLRQHGNPCSNNSSTPLAILNPCVWFLALSEPSQWRRAAGVGIHNS
ncbi:Cytoplasmic phosphatidylinositol transfer protein 1 [Varanus komodoensis]|nr:Cytoplasmic phosphatidylinositol transfer protein 1 [Varanus komodoensis]